MMSFIERLLNPLLSPVFAFTLLIALLPYQNPIIQDLQGLHWLVACIFSSGLIFVYISYLKHKKVIHTTALVEREHRINPLTGAILSYAIGYLLLTALNAQPIVRALMFAYIINTTLLLIITRRWKISLHTTALATSVTALVYQWGWLLTPLFGLVAIVGVARLQTQKQDVFQVSAGALLGILSTTAQFYWRGV